MRPVDFALCGIMLTCEGLLPNSCRRTRRSHSTLIAEAEEGEYSMANGQCCSRWNDPREKQKRRLGRLGKSRSFSSRNSELRGFYFCLVDESRPFITELDKDLTFPTPTSRR
jgi:hypothetical protein